MDGPSTSHPTDQTLHAHGLRKLDARAAAAVDRHLEGCAACNRRVVEMSGDRPHDPPGDAGARREPPTVDPSLADSLPPELVDNAQYEVLNELGRGGMGIVYLARNKVMDRLEVLKVLNKEMLERKGVLDRFLREIRAVARLNHPNVVTAFAAPQIGRLLVFAMEYVEGDDLAKLVKAHGPLPVPSACQYVYQAALGLQHAHEQGMVHRDIKPGNLMLARQGQRRTIKLLDFGLAKATSENPVDGSLTREGQMLGTPDYLAPEQSLAAHKADIRADIYSLGCTLYYLLTGGPPFEGTSLAAIILSHHATEAKPLHLVRPEVPAELEAVVRKMMAKEKETRFQTPEEVARALRPFCKTRSLGSGGPGTVGSRAGADAEATAKVAPAGPGAAAAKSPADVRWESLIVVPTPGHTTGETAAVAGPARDRPPWRWPALVLGLVLSGFAVAWTAGVFLDKTPGPPAFATGHPGSERPLPPVPVPDEPPRRIRNSIGMKLALIPAGGFPIGAPDGDKDAESDETPQHEVRIARPFYLGVHEVTQGQYRAVTGVNPSAFKDSDDLPVETVSWWDVIEFCNALSAKERLEHYYHIGGIGGNRTVTIPDRDGAGYRLPTEAEWEFACRAGSSTRYSFGDAAARLDDFGWYLGNSGRQTHPVGQKRPNAWDLHDMYGNVWEWCWDWYNKDGYRRSPGADSHGPALATDRVDRGGGWSSFPLGCRSSVRSRLAPEERNFYLGFRVARAPSGH